MSRILVIMAAGMGSRFGGDKQIAKIGPSGEMLMEYSVFDALRYGFNRIIFVIRSGMEQSMLPLLSAMRTAHPDIEFILAEQKLSESYNNIAISQHRSKPLGTVHALLSAAPFIDSPFAVINADDYYGKHAFHAISAAVESLSSSKEAAMVVYSLRNTLSRHGAVTRGVCCIDGRFLKSIRESYKVSFGKDGLIYEQTENGLSPVSDESMVSMNMWAFHHNLMDEIENYFCDFLSALAHNDDSSECLLPIMAESFIETGKINITAHPTDSRWFGLTYREDSEDAAWELDKRHQDGTYPEKLF